MHLVSKSVFDIVLKTFVGNIFKAWSGKAFCGTVFVIYFAVWTFNGPCKPGQKKQCAEKYRCYINEFYYISGVYTIISLKNNNNM